MLRGDELQLARGESIGDTARILSRYVHAIAIRAGSDDNVVELAQGASVPVINALTPAHHPCQALADLLTLRERFGDLHGLRLAYVGDGNNVARSLAILGRTAGVEVVVASPRGLPARAGPGRGGPRRPARGGGRRRRGLHGRVGEHGRRGGGASAGARTWRRTGSTPSCWMPPRTGRSSSTASPPIPARRSPRTSSTASAPPSGTRPRTASTRRRRCSSCCSADRAGLVAPHISPQPAQRPQVDLTPTLRLASAPWCKGQHAGLSSRKSRVRIPSGPFCGSSTTGFMITGGVLLLADDRRRGQAEAAGKRRHLSRRGRSVDVSCWRTRRRARPRAAPSARPSRGSRRRRARSPR